MVQSPPGIVPYWPPALWPVAPVIDGILGCGTELAPAALGIDGMLEPPEDPVLDVGEGGFGPADEEVGPFMPEATPAVCTTGSGAAVAWNIGVPKACFLNVPPKVS